MKYEWRKKEKDLYLPPTAPTLVDLKPMNYLVIEGQGNPNSKGFSTSVGALYALAYGIRIAPKQGIDIPGYYEYTVYPLEAIWGCTEEGKRLYREGKRAIELKDHMTYRAMIRQPEFVTEALVNSLKVGVVKKKKNPLVAQLEFLTLDEGQSIQMTHVGPYDDEPASFEKLESFAESQGLKRRTMVHKEIYVTDPNKVSSEKLRTTLRIWVE